MPLVVLAVTVAVLHVRFERLFILRPQHAAEAIAGAEPDDVIALDRDAGDLHTWDLHLQRPLAASVAQDSPVAGADSDLVVGIDM